jgi:hypothetical protein
MTTSWREHLNFPRLLSDKIGHLESDLAWGAQLSVADTNIAFRSFVPEVMLGSKDGLVPRHSAAHSRRMGYLTGQMLGKAPSEAAIAMSTLVQPASADDGEPVSEQVYHDWLEQHSADFVHVGWRLGKITAHASSVDASGEPAGAGPDVALHISIQRNTGLPNSLQALPWLRGGYNATWSPQVIVMNGSKCELTLDSRTRLSSLVGTCSKWAAIRRRVWHPAKIRRPSGMQNFSGMTSIIDVELIMYAHEKRSRPIGERPFFMD